MYCMMSMLGIIMTACFFMPSIMVSMLAGSKGEAGLSPSPSGLGLRYSPEASAPAVAAENARYCSGCKGERGADARRSWARLRARLGVRSWPRVCDGSPGPGSSADAQRPRLLNRARWKGEAIVNRG